MLMIPQSPSAAAASVLFGKNPAAFSERNTKKFILAKDISKYESEVKA